MAYTKFETAWADLPSTETPIIAEGLDHIEQGIFEAAAMADAGLTIGDLALVASTGSYLDLTNRPTLGTAAATASTAYDAAGAAVGAQANAIQRVNHTGSQLASTISDFTEAAQDAVGAAMTDTATIDFTYTDASNTITADVKNGSLGTNKLNFTPLTTADLGSFMVSSNDTIDDQIVVTQAAYDALGVGWVAKTMYWIRP